MMKYETCRTLIDDGDLILVRGHSWRSWFIRQWTQSRYSHCGLAVWITVGSVRRLCVLEATEGVGVHLIPLSHVLGRDGEVDWYALSRTEAFDVESIMPTRIIEFATSVWGRRYATWWQFIRSFSVATTRLFDYLGFDIDTDPDRFFCSEFVTAALGAGGFRPSHDVDPAAMSPGDVAELACFSRRGRISLKGKTDGVAV